MKVKNTHLKKLIEFMKSFILGTLPERTTPFCAECGDACCQFGEGVRLRPKEVERYLGLLEEDRAFFDGEGRLLFRNGRCPLLSKEGVCTCYNERSQTCRYWTCIHNPSASVEIFEKFPHVLELIMRYRPDIYRKIKKKTT